MNFKAHTILGTVSAAGIGYAAYHYNIVNLSALKVAIPAIILGGLFPDVDCESKPSKIYATLLLVFSVYWFIRETPGYTLLMLIPYLLAKMDKHRGWTHSFWVPAILFFTCFVIKSITYYIPVEFKHWAETITRYRLHIVGFSCGIVAHDIIDIISTFLKKKGIIGKKS